MSAALALYTEEEIAEPTLVCDMRSIVTPTFILPPPRPFYKCLDVTPDPGIPGRWRLLGFDVDCQEWVELLADSSVEDCLASVGLYK